MIYLKEVREGDVNKRAGIVIVDGKSILGCLPCPKDTCKKEKLLLKQL